MPKGKPFMKWMSLLTLIAAENERFGDAPLPSLRPCTHPKELLDEHKRAEAELRPSVDAAVRLFARERRWPSLSGNERYFIQQRLAVAFFIAGFLATPDKSGKNPILPEPPDSFADDDQIEWILISGWHTAGCRMWFGHQRIRIGMLHGQKP